MKTPAPHFLLSVMLLVAAAPVRGAHRDSQGRFAIEAPEGWKTVPAKDKFVFMAPDGQSAIHVEMVTLPQQPKLEQEAQRMAGILRKEFNALMLPEGSRQGTVAGKSALQCLYTMKPAKGAPGKVVTTLVETKNGFLVVWMVASTETYAASETLYQKCLNSVQFPGKDDGEADPEALQKKLAALEAALEAGVLDREEYERKKAEFAGTKGSQPPSRKLKAWQLAQGLNFWCPADWQVTRQQGILLLVPPRQAAHPRTGAAPMETYTIAASPLNATSKAWFDGQDQNVVQFLESSFRQQHAKLKRVGDISTFPMRGTRGGSCEWKTRANGVWLRIRALYCTYGDFFVLLTAYGRQSTLNARNADIRAVFSSLGSVQAPSFPAGRTAVVSSPQRQDPASPPSAVTHPRQETVTRPSGAGDPRLVGHWYREGGVTAAPGTGGVSTSTYSHWVLYANGRSIERSSSDVGGRGVYFYGLQHEKELATWRAVLERKQVRWRGPFGWSNTSYEGRLAMRQADGKAKEYL